MTMLAVSAALTLALLPTTSVVPGISAHRVRTMHVHPRQSAPHMKAVDNGRDDSSKDDAAFDHEAPSYAMAAHIKAVDNGRDDSSKDDAAFDHEAPSYAMAAAALAASLPHSALAASVPNAVPSALAAYGHYLGLILAVLCLATERLTVKENMSAEEEDRIAIADAVYGLAGLLVVYTGYLRVTVYGKGWEFYSHEPIFWLKMTLVAVMGASSFFPTTKIIQRAVAKQQAGGTLASPMSAKLASRMTSIINAELLALLAIPMAATFMARGVGYAEWLPWQAGAAPAALALGGLGFKYVKEALDWQEDEGA